ncbi:MAG: alpha/beta hydrolase [Burkholderiales bacterium]|nr:alpha/beta hydrolase [Bacteroidia bacterium]
MKYLSKLIGLALVLVSLNACDTDTEKEKVRVVVPSATKDSFVYHIDAKDPKYKKFPYLLAYDKALSLWGVPFEEKDFKTKYGKAHVIISGPETGEPLVLLHGMNASSTMWYPNIKALSEKYHVYAIDFLLEPGKSLCEIEISQTSEIVSWYYEIFDYLKLKNFSLLGASRGGWIATNIALHDPTRVNKMILLSPAQTFVWIRPGVKAFNNIAYTISPKRRRLRNVLETMTNNVDNISQLYLNQYYIATEKASISKCFIQMIPFADNELQSLTMPVLVLIGENDIINNKKSLERAKKLIKHCEVGTIKNAGHFLSMDKSDVVNQIMIDFMEKKIQGMEPK